MKCFQRVGVCAAFILLLSVSAFADNSVTPNGMSFLAVVGGANPAAQNFAVSPFSASGAWTAQTDGAPWISISTTSGAGNGTIVVSVTTGSLAAGAYSSTVNVTFAGDPRQYAQAVQFNVAPKQVTFTANLGGSNPASQTLQLSFASGGTTNVNWSATVNTTTGGAWLSVSPASSSSTPGSTGTLTVSATVATLAVGTYTGTITLAGGAFFTGGMNNDTVIPVQLNVTTPAFQLSPTSTTLTGTPGGPVVQSQPVAVTASQAWVATVTATTGGSWLSTTPTSGNGNGSFTVNADPSKLQASSTPYTGTISIGPSAQNSTAVPVTFGVTFLVSGSAITVAPTQLAFNVTAGNTVKTMQTVAVTTTLQWTPTVRSTSGGNWLSVQTAAPSPTTGNGSFTVVVDPSQITGGPGQYTATLSVAPPTGTGVTIPVTLTAGAATISVTPTTLSFQQVQAATPAAAKTVMLSATPAVGSWSVATTNMPSWLSVSPNSGSFGQTASIYPNASSMSLGPGSYQTTVTFADSNGSPTSLAVQVVLTVTAPTGAPVLAVLPTTIIVTGGVATTPLPVYVQISNNGGGTLNWQATLSVVFLLNGQSTPLSQGSGTATPGSPSIINLRLPNLPGGLYAGNLTFTAGTQTQTVPIIFQESNIVYRVPETGFSFYMTAGGTPPPPQTLYIQNPLSSSQIFTIAQERGQVQETITSPVPIAAGNAGSATITVPASASSLAAGEYDSTFVISEQNAPSTEVLVQLHVLPPTAPPGPSAYPLGFALTPTVLTQSVQLSAANASSLPFTLSVSTLSGGNWLTATSTSTQLGATGATVNVAASASSLPTTPGVYQGTVTVSYPTIPSSQDITVFLVIPKNSGTHPEITRGASGLTCTPAQMIMALRGLGSNFNSTVGYPVNLEAQLIDDCGNPITSATVIAGFSTGDPALSLSLIGTGIYGATWTPLSANPATVTITGINAGFTTVTGIVPGTVGANATPPPVISANGFVNGASFTQNGQVSPGAIVSLFGSNLATGNNGNSGFPLPTTLGGIKVTMGGVDTPLFFAGNGQVNAQVPTTLTPNSQISVQARGFSGNTEMLDSVPASLFVQATTPGIFLAPETNLPNQGAILNNPGLQVIDASHPATAGDVITIYCTGLGATNPSVPTGLAAPSTQPLALVTSPVTVTFGTQTTPVIPQFVGLTPGLVGLYQVNVAVPAGLQASNAVTVVLNQNGLTSNAATIAVH